MTSFETVHNGESRGRRRSHQEDLHVDPCDPKFPQARQPPSTTGCRQTASHLQQSFLEMRIEASKASKRERQGPHTRSNSLHFFLSMGSPPAISTNQLGFHHICSINSEFFQ
ncbi:uncharacterized protein LOC116255696 isoform X2 [Nymphaea colorata]|uniref:uncharacterized protein LOC116255696 isoform X2 n=1 Tax=Nymphaea colorata TaxID=210225 RepID=UPI00129EADC9|nr:uncharacterized protein LOC116255696 isoform X2 [Nymphaea colorata]